MSEQATIVYRVDVTAAEKAALERIVNAIDNPKLTDRRALELVVNHLHVLRDALDRMTPVGSETTA